MEDVENGLTNDDLLKMISMLENPAEARMAHQFSSEFMQHSHVKSETPLSGQFSPMMYLQYPNYPQTPQSSFPPAPSMPQTPMLFGSQHYAAFPQLPSPQLTSVPQQSPSAMLATPQAHPQHGSMTFMAHQMPSQPAAFPAQTISMAPPQPKPLPQLDLSQVSGGLQPAGQLLNEIYQAYLFQKEQLEKLRQFQKQIMLQPQKEGYERLDQHQKQLKAQLDQEIKALQQLHHSVLLSPADISRYTYLMSELRVQMHQLELYHQELQMLTQPQHLPRLFAALAIVEQPFPMVITKGKQLDDDPITVQLLSGAAVEFTSFSKMKVAMILENHQAKVNPTNQKTVENDTMPLDPYRRHCKWHLKFVNGTRKNAVTLKFGIQVQVGAGPTAQTLTVESDHTGPFIVITNECQWEESEGTLIKKEAFGELPEVPWPHFANILQRHFLRATRQDPSRPARCLSLHDLEYLHSKLLGGQPMISQKAFDSFWAWFGKGIQKLRYQRHICPLWQNGLIYGFITREGVEEALRNEDLGTFLIRFSERHPGMFAVGYKIEDPDPTKCVRHYLIRPDDTAGAKKTLPDFLAEQPAFVSVLQVTVDGIDGQPILRKFAKDAVFEPYYSKRASISSVNGYDDSVTTRTSAGGMHDAGGDDNEDVGDESESFMG